MWPFAFRICVSACLSVVDVAFVLVADMTVIIVTSMGVPGCQRLVKVTPGSCGLEAEKKHQSSPKNTLYDIKDSL